MLLGDLAHRGATLWPDRTAFAWDGRGRTYREPRERVLRWRRLLAGEGVRHGDRIALLTVTAPEAIETAFAASLLGASKRLRWYGLVETIPRNHPGKILERGLRAAHDPATAVRLPESGG